MPPVTFRNLQICYGEELLYPSKPPRLNEGPTTVHSGYSQLRSVSGGRALHSQPEVPCSSVDNRMGAPET
jgi:hypothetical protein